MCQVICAQLSGLFIDVYLGPVVSRLSTLTDCRPSLSAADAATRCTDKECGHHVRHDMRPSQQLRWFCVDEALLSARPVSACPINSQRFDALWRVLANSKGNVVRVT